MRWHGIGRDEVDMLYFHNIGELTTTRFREQKRKTEGLKLGTGLREREIGRDQHFDGKAFLCTKYTQCLVG